MSRDMHSSCYMRFEISITVQAISDLIVCQYLIDFHPETTHSPRLKIFLQFSENSALVKRRKTRTIRPQFTVGVKRVVSCIGLCLSLTVNE